MKGRASREKNHQVRLYHKKSRNGCLRCKARRVKCDEAKPTCGSCARHALICEYQQPVPSSRAAVAEPRTREKDFESWSTSPTTGDTTTQSTDSADRHQQDDESAYDLPESKQRRMMELTLLNNFQTVVRNPFFGTQHDPKDIEEMTNVTSWSGTEVPKIALQHENLLHVMFAISASFLLQDHPEDQELLAAHETYFGMAVHEQRKAVAELSNENADAICFAAIMILIDSLVSMRRRSLEPYAPPTEWLQMGQGARSVLRVVVQHMGRSGNQSKVMTLITAAPALPLDDEDRWVTEENRKVFAGILNHRVEEEFNEREPEIREAYDRTLCYIASTHLAAQKGGTISAIARRISGFSILVPARFVKFVEEGRPRALVTLAQFFGVANDFRQIWWMGNTPEREIWGLYRSIPAEWLPLMDWPMRRVGLTPMIS